MFLTLPTIQKLFRECFQGKTPIRVEPRELPKVSEQWQQRLAGLDGIRLSHHPGDRDSRARTICRFTIDDPHVERQVFRSDEVRLEYDNDFNLRLSVRRPNADAVFASVSHFDELSSLVRKVQSRYARAEAARKKKRRLRDFKARAIIAKVRKLACVHDFEFAEKIEDSKIRLFVRLSQKDLAEISIPFDEYEPAVRQLDASIETLRLIHESGLRLKMVTDGVRTRSLDWKRPD